jgi:hypothetical protein
MLQDHVTRLENTVRRRWSAGDVEIWTITQRSTKAIDDYGDHPRIVRRDCGALRSSRARRYFGLANVTAEAYAFGRLILQTVGRTVSAASTLATTCQPHPVFSSSNGSSAARLPKDMMYMGWKNW